MQDIFWNNQQTVDSFAARPCSSYITNIIDHILENHHITDVIDIGCGGGRYSLYLKNKNISVLAVDKNNAMVERVKQSGIRAKVCNMTSLPVENNSIDMALSIGVIHNATTKQEYGLAIKEIARTLKIGGFAIVSVFTNKTISEDLTYIGSDKYSLSEGKPPMILLPKAKIIQMFECLGLELIKEIDEHETNVGTGERNVLSLYFRKKQ